ncbi:MAG: apolipoprotein N-acyltransferase [Candidatus Omnitrophica bacterium]|nr:apolipoprotein N-acyltransferase [Candidatus Omnitrophota bacterium]
MKSQGCTIATLQAVKNLGHCLLSALTLIFSFPDFNIWFLAWVAFVPLFLVTSNKSQRETFFLFFITGIIFWAGIIYWLAHVTLAGMILLILYLALYFALFGLIIRPYRKNSTNFSLIFIPAVWVLCEYLRSWLFTGFPWALLGYSQYLNLPVIQIADITGSWGVSFLVMLINVGVTEAIRSLKQDSLEKLKTIILLTASIIILVLSYGYFCLSGQPAQETNSPIHISVIQGNIPQSLKWEERYAESILAQYAGLTRKAAQNGLDLVVWPEAAVPGVLGEDNWVYEKVFSLAREIKTPLLSGAVVKDKGYYFGSALLINDSGRIVGRYDKLHLVPFGEYIPLKRFLPFLEVIVPIGDIQRGKEYTVFKLLTASRRFLITFSVLDCFEDLFPALAREFTKRGVDFLINITNDAWYKKSPAAFQHFQASVFRAVENRRYVVRSANTGVSGFIAPTGKVVSFVQDEAGNRIFIEGYREDKLYIAGRRLTFYTRYGDAFIIICILCFIYGILSSYFKKRFGL